MPTASKLLKTKQKQIRFTIPKEMQIELDILKKEFHYLNDIEIIKMLLGKAIKEVFSQNKVKKNKPLIKPISIGTNKTVYISKNHNDIYDQ
jgi:hypothetical protein